MTLIPENLYLNFFTANKMGPSINYSRIRGNIVFCKKWNVSYLTIFNATIGTDQTLFNQLYI